MNEEVKKSIYGMKDRLTEIRRDFHQNPELGNLEFRTQEKIKEYLTQMNIPFITYPNDTCVVGLIQGEKPGKTVAIRADMDALPIRDGKNCSYKSQTTA